MSNLLNWRARLFGTPLLLTTTYAEVVVSVLADRLGVEPVVGRSTVDAFSRPKRIRASVASVLNRPAAGRYVRPGNEPSFDPRTGIATYPIVGSMVHRGDGVDALSGIQSYTALQRDLGVLLDSPKVRAILLDLDTPGGEAAGIVELSDWIRAARDEKPIWALANTSACSGGYWIASACSRIVAAPMSSVGSIGVVTMHTDVSKAAEKRGLVHTFIHAGKHKVDGHPYAPLPDDVRAEIQAGVDSLYDTFVSTVAELRGLDGKAVRATEAAIFGPDAAMSLGLVDSVGTLGQTLAALADALDRSPAKPGATLPGDFMTPAEEAAFVAHVDAVMDLPEAKGREVVAMRLAMRRPRLSPNACAGLLRGIPADSSANAIHVDEPGPKAPGRTRSLHAPAH